MLTHDQQVKRALIELKPPPDAIAQCKRDIETALEAVEWNGLDPRPNSQKIRQIVEPLLAALSKSRTLYNELAAIDHAHAHELMRGAPDLDVHIASYKEWLSVDPDPDAPRRSAAKQKAAVKEARALVLKYCERKQDHSATRKNKWWKLSAILFGDPKFDCLNHMASLKKQT